MGEGVEAHHNDLSSIMGGTDKVENMNGSPGKAPIEAVEGRQKAVLEKRIVYRHGLTCAVAKPPQGAVILTKMKQNMKQNGKTAVQPTQQDPTRPSPGTELCDEADVDKLMSWTTVKRPDTGLRNHGVTCYINATLQCLMFTPPLANYLKDYRPNHKGAGVDWLEMLASVTKFSVLPPRAQSIHNPAGFSKNLRRLSPTLRQGRLEDAQEFCNFLLDACHEQQLKKYADKKDRLVQETTPIKTIVGGFFQSKIQWSKEEEILALKKKCAKTKKPFPEEAHNTEAASSTFEPFTFLTVDLVGADLDKALQGFTKPESLSGENMFETPSGVKVNAKKMFSIYRSPRVLIVHLKRFVSNMFGDTKKVNKFIEFPTELDLAPYSTGFQSRKYELYAVLVHIGRGLHSGHYVSYVKAGNGVWYQMDDEDVRQVSVDDVMRQQAYLLFYRSIAVKDTQRIEQSNGNGNGNGNGSKKSRKNAATNGTNGTTNGTTHSPAVAPSPSPKPTPSPTIIPSGAPLSKRQKRNEAKRIEALQHQKEVEEKATLAAEAQRAEEAKKAAEEAKKVAEETPKPPTTKKPKRKFSVLIEPEGEEEKQEPPVKKLRPAAESNGAESAVNTPTKRHTKRSRKKYESAALNQQDAFEMPADKEKFWEDCAAEDKVREDAADMEGASDNEAMPSTIKGDATEAFATKLVQDEERHEEAVLEGVAAAQSNASKKRKREPEPTDTATEGEKMLKKAKQDIGSIKAQSLLEARAQAHTTVWAGVDVTARNAILKKGQSKKMKSAKEMVCTF